MGEMVAIAEVCIVFHRLIALAIREQVPASERDINCVLFICSYCLANGLKLD